MTVAKKKIECKGIEGVGGKIIVKILLGEGHGIQGGGS